MTKKLDDTLSKTVMILGATSIVFAVFFFIDFDLFDILKLGSKGAVTLVVLGILTLIIGYLRYRVLVLVMALIYGIMSAWALYQFTLPGSDRYFGGNGSVFALLLGFFISLSSIALAKVTLPD